MANICIIGGGISGLTTAYKLMSDHDVVVLESRAQTGGWVQSYKHPSGAIINEAPNGWLNSKPSTLDLIQSLGLESDIIKANPDATRWIWHKGKQVALPAKPQQLLTSPLLSVWAKLRLLFEPFMANRHTLDESLAQFVERRFGSGVLDTLVAPMCAGIFAAAPEELSAAAAFPLLIELEQKHGSLIKGLQARQKEGHPRPVLTSLKHGVGQLTQKLSDVLGERIRLDLPAQSIQPHQDRWRVHTNHDAIDADVVVLSCPAYAQAKVLRGCIPELAKHLEEIPYHSLVVAAAMTARKRLAKPPQGFGTLVARGSELHGALGVLFSSEIFPCFAPDDMVLTRSILGGSRYPEIASLDEQSIHHRVQKIHSDLLGLQGSFEAVDIHIHKRAVPCYTTNHMRRQLAIKALQERHPGLYISGNHLFGIGVKDCIHNAYNLAQQAHHYIYPPTVA